MADLFVSAGPYKHMVIFADTKRMAVTHYGCLCCVLSGGAICGDFLMEDEHSQWIGTACYYYGVFCRSTENARPPSKNPCGTPLCLTAILLDEWDVRVVIKPDFPFH